RGLSLQWRMPGWIRWDMRIRGQRASAIGGVFCEFGVQLHRHWIVVHFRIHDQASRLRWEPELLARFGSIGQHDRHSRHGQDGHRGSGTERKSASGCESVFELWTSVARGLYDLPGERNII